MPFACGVVLNPIVCPLQEKASLFSHVFNIRKDQLNSPFGVFGKWIGVFC